MKCVVQQMQSFRIKGATRSGFRALGVDRMRLACLRLVMHPVAPFAQRKHLRMGQSESVCLRGTLADVTRHATDEGFHIPRHSGG